MGISSGSKLGQISVEYTIIMASMLLILTILVVIFNGIYVQQALHTNQLQASHAVTLLAAGASDVWAQGAGAEEKYTVDIPSSIDLSSSSIENYTIRLNVPRFGDVFANTKFNVSGTWPAKTGIFFASIYNNGTHVLIRPSGRLSLSATGFYFNASGTKTLVALNRANASYTVTQTFQFPSCPACTYDAPSPKTLQSGENVRGTITISAPALSSGLYTGYIKIDAEPDASSGMPIEKFIIPITISIN